MLGDRRRLLPRQISLTRTGFTNKKEFMSFKQITEGPIPLLPSHPCQSFKWFSVVDEKSRINTRNKTAGVIGRKEATAEFRIFDVSYGGSFHDRLRMFLDKVK